jgi:3-methyl-2-oxobutanoate hydroxymethyltransferase
MSTPPKTTRTTVPSLRARKRRLGSPPLVVLTAYDAATTAVGEAGGVDALLVGDPGMVVLGYESTLPVTLTSSPSRAVGRIARGRS